MGFEKEKEIIERAYADSDDASKTDIAQWRECIDHVFASLDQGALCVAEKNNGQWIVHEWVKKAILLYFRFHPNRVMDSGAIDGGMMASWFDKVGLKSAGWDKKQWEQAGFRAVPGAWVRKSAYIAPGAVLMPCFVNIGARVGQGTMIDTWATVGSCAQIGQNCHISGGAGIGGVLEPLQATPVIIEDQCFIGARSEIAEGVIVETGSVISMGVYIGASTRIIDRESGKIHYGRVPAYSVVVAGSHPSSSTYSTMAGGGTAPSLYCAVIVKRVDARTRAKTSINQLLREDTPTSMES